MKILAPLSAVILTAALTLPAAAQPVLQLSRDMVSTHGPLVPGPTIQINKIDPDLLHPKPKRIPIPVPGPWCLSCPTNDFGQELVLPQMR